MNWLQRFHLLDAPPNATLESAELTLRGVFPWWVALAILLLTGAGVALLYSREGGQLGSLRRALLTILRIGIVALVLVLLLRPVLLAEFKGERPRPVVLLLDNSQSMKQQDRRYSTADRVRAAIARGLIPPGGDLTDSSRLVNIPTEEIQGRQRIDLVKSVLGNESLKWLDQLHGKGPVQPFLLGRRLTRPALEEGSLGQGLTAILNAGEGQTALADGIHDLLARGGTDLPAAIVVVTDGRDNASKLTLEEAARECREKGVPLHIWGVGSSEGGTLELREVAMPSTVFVDEKADTRDDVVEVPVRWRLRGVREGTVVLTLSLGDQTIEREYTVQPIEGGKVVVTWKVGEETRRLTVREGEDVQETISMTPAKSREESRKFVARIALRDREDFRDRVERKVQVKNGKVKVLYVESTPRREYKFLQPILDRDRRVLARFLLTEGDPRLAEARADPKSGSMFLKQFPENFPNPAPLDPDRRPYDVLILGDVPPATLGKDNGEAVKRFVEEGGGLVVIAGRRFTPARYVETRLGRLLPVEFAAREFKVTPQTRTQPFKPVLTYDGQQSPLLSLADNSEENLRLWREELWKDREGQFYWHYPVTGLKAGATALLVHPEEKVGDGAGDRPMPLIARQYGGRGEVLFLGIDETWRWRQDRGDKLTGRFWGQVVQQLGLPHLLGASRRVQMTLEGGEPTVGRRGAVKARLLSETYTPRTEPTVPATLTYLGNQEGDPVSERTIQLRAIKAQPGEYRASLPNDTPGRYQLKVEGSAGQVPLEYRVELPPRHELETAGMAEDDLRAMAAASGGRFYREENLQTLPEKLESRQASFVLRQEVLLWNPLTLVLFVLLITAEWVLRKFSNLS